MAVVVLFDIDESAAAEWARENCASFAGWYVYEADILPLDDDELEWYIKYEFEFSDEHEAMMFQLRWQGQ